MATMKKPGFRGCVLIGMAFACVVVLAGCSGKVAPAPRTPQASHGMATIPTFRPYGSPMAGGGG